MNAAEEASDSGDHMQSAASSSITSYSSIGSASPTAAAAANAVRARPNLRVLWLWCLKGALVGWTERDLERSYQASRLQHHHHQQQQAVGASHMLSRPMTWVAMGIIFICLNTVGIVRLLKKILVVYTGQVLVTAVYVVLFIALPELCYGVWLLLCPPSWPRVGSMALRHLILRLAAYIGQGLFIGYAPFEQVMRGGLNERMSYTFYGPLRLPHLQFLFVCLFVYTMLFATVDILLHQLLPPWLLQNAAVLCFFMLLQWFCMPGMWDYGVLGLMMPPWVQAVGLTALGVGMVAGQEAAERYKYIRAQAAAAAATTGAPAGKKGGGAFQAKGKVE